MNEIQAKNEILERWKTQVNTRVLPDFIDSKFWIEENINYSPGYGNLFLMTGKRDLSVVCVGGAEKHLNEQWEASISAPYCPESDTDSICVYAEGTRHEAIAALWESRFDAFVE